MEDLRQPAPQSRARGIDAPVAPGLDGLVIRLVLDLVGDRASSLFLLCLPLSGIVPEAGRCASGPAPRCHRALGWCGHFAQAAFTLVCLPYEAFFSLDAIIRTGGRILITHKRLLEWNPSGDRERPGRSDLARLLAGPCGSPRLSLSAAAIYLAFSKPAALAVAGPILGLWFASPAIAWWISRPLARRAAKIDGRPDPLSPEAFPKDLGVLRDLRRPGRSLAAAG